VGHHTQAGRHDRVQRDGNGSEMRPLLLHLAVAAQSIAEEGSTATFPVG
jgi:hypothetical protein